MNKTFQTTNTDFTLSEIRLLSAIEELLDRKLDEKLDQKLDEKLGQQLDAHLTPRFDDLEKKFDSKLNKLEKKFDAKFDSVERQIREINLLLENEFRPNISIIAEGHLDLNRKLDQALHLMEESQRKWESLSLKVNYHDAQLRCILQ